LSSIWESVIDLIFWLWIELALIFSFIHLEWHNLFILTFFFSNEIIVVCIYSLMIVFLSIEEKEILSINSDWHSTLELHSFWHQKKYHLKDSYNQKKISSKEELMIKMFDHNMHINIFLFFFDKMSIEYYY